MFPSIQMINARNVGIPIALTGTDNGLGKKVLENAEPFYKKEN